MKLGIMADSHDRLTMMDRALSLFAAEKVDLVVHAGDIVAPFAAEKLAAAPYPVKAVFGNNDGEYPGLSRILVDIDREPRRFEIDGVRFLLVHDIKLLDPDINDTDVVIHGHTHSASAETENGRLVINPGETCAYVTGRSTVAFLDTDDLSYRIVDL